MFIRSTAAGTGSAGWRRRPARPPRALAVAFDVVVIETVGVGQSETEVADVADTVAVVVQPGSGDVLQFLKAGIMEVPDVLVVTKADLAASPTRPSPTCGAALRSLARPKTAGGVGLMGRPADRDRRARRRARPASRCRSPPAPAAESAAGAALADFVAEHGERGLRRSAAAAPPNGGWPNRTRRSMSRR